MPDLFLLAGGAENAGDAFALGDGEDAVDGGQMHSLDAAAGPVDLNLVDFGRGAESEVDALVVG